MEIRLLGRFEVLLEGEPLALGGPRPRALLATLAVHANEVVSLDRLIDEVWGGAPPATALTTLQRYVSRLRSALAGLPVEIKTQRPGYLLQVSPEAIDARRFERMVEEGRRRLDADEADAAADVLEAALAMWQGEPLADFVYDPFARFEITRLDELRTVAVELRIEALLAAGRCHQVIPELEALVAAEPLRESYRGLLMRALSGAGRRAEALRVYTAGRRLFADELGLDPSVRLQEIERAILVGDVDLDAAAARHPATGGAGGGPSPLPAPSTALVGRGDDVAALIALLTRARLVTVTGAGGVGKTRVALAAAAEVAPSLRGGGHIVSLDDVSDAAAVTPLVAAAVGASDGGLGSLLDALRTRETVLVLDTCAHVLDAVATLASQILAHCPGVRVVATGREILEVPGEVALRIFPLSVPAAVYRHTKLADVAEFDGVRLFLDLAVAANGSLAPGDRDVPAIVEACRRLDGLPLAMELAAPHLDVLTLHELARRLREPLDLLAAGHRTAAARHQSLRAMIAWSYDRLSADEQLLFDRLSVFTDAFTVETMEAVCTGGRLQSEDAMALLTRLVRKSLVVRVSDAGTTARFSLLHCYRHFAQERLHERRESAHLLQRHAAFFDQTRAV